MDKTSKAPYAIRQKKVDAIILKQNLITKIKKENFHTRAVILGIFLSIGILSYLAS